MIPAKPTTGAGGVNFRSRLEARWAQWLTLCEWPWQYEPELDLNAWIPDFGITQGGGLLIEVKPAITMAGLMAHRERIEASKVVAPVWLVGGALSLGQKDYEPILGWFGFDGGSGVWDWRPARLAEVKKHAGMHEPVDFKVAQRLWVQAGNELQWRRKA